MFIRTEEAFSKWVLEVDLENMTISKITQMMNGRDLRNKIWMVDEKVYIVGVA